MYELWSNVMIWLWYVLPTKQMSVTVKQADELSVIQILGKSRELYYIRHLKI